MKHFKDKIGLKYENFDYALTCDTMVEFEGVSLGKPIDLVEAKKWLMSYSGKKQMVHTGSCLRKLDGLGQDKSWVETTEITFKKFGVSEVNEYLKSNLKILGKAGAYGIQDESFNLISGIKGSYTNIVGLPLEPLNKHLKQWNF